MSFLKKLLLTSAILNVCWTFIGSQIGRLFHKDFGGLIIGLGFLVIYSVTFFLYFDKRKKSIHNFLILTSTIIAIFLTASFIPTFLFVNGSTDLSVIGFLLCSSTIAFIGIVAIVGHYTDISNKKATIILGSIVTAFIVYGVIKYAPDHIGTDKWNNIINPIALAFCIWQVLTTFLIGRSIAIPTRLQPTKVFVKAGRTR